MALKDKSDIVQQYAMVNVNQFTTLITTGTSIQACLESYTNLLADNGIKTDIDVDSVIEHGSSENGTVTVSTVAGTVTDIRSAVINGDSCYYLRLDTSEAYYAVYASDFETVVIVNIGDTVEITHKESDEAIIEAESFTVK